MKIYTAHVRPDRAPVLVREGFSWPAFIFGAFWLAAHGAWIAAILVAVVEIAVGLLVHGLPGVALGLFVAWVTGIFGQDLRRWSLGRRGYRGLHVIAARDEPTAFGRLLAIRPDLVGVGF